MKFEQDIEQAVPFKHYDPVRKFNMSFRVSFRGVEMDDIELLHGWMHEAHVISYWQMDISFEEYKKHLELSLADAHQKLLIGNINGRPVSYWEIYWVKNDLIDGYYDFDAFDQGIHLLIGNKDYLGKGYIYPLLMTILHHQFQVSKTEKVMAEPDIQNEKMIHVFRKCGFSPVKEIELPDKTAMLMACERESFERRWMDWQQNKF